MSGEAAEQARAAVRELTECCDQAGEAPRERIRMIGARPESAGGVELMLAAHPLFSKERRPLPQPT